MPRKQREIDRDSGRVERDIWLIVIASEDYYAVDRYFKRFNNPRIQVVPLPPDNEQRSSPIGIVDRLDKYRKEIEIGADDQLWYCGDTDHWFKGTHLKSARQALQRCRHNGYGVALSNPCFEFWLLLHYLDPPSEKDLTAEEALNQLKEYSGGYSKKYGLSTDVSDTQVEFAVSRAASRPASHHRVPRTNGSSVFKIVEVIRERTKP